MNAIFISSFINTGIILLLTNAELKYSILGFIPIHNQFSDINKQWYTDVGPSMVQTMIIMAFYPYAEFIIFWGIKALQRWMDGRGDKPTKTTTISQYINLYAGPEYLMHFKYSSILVQVYVSFMYGLFIPLLIPIALIGIINMYLVERLSLAYYYRVPPMYDHRMNKSAINTL